MTKEENKDHETIEAALAAAQLEMGPAIKDAVNPHLKNKYADLASVMAACMGPLNRHGIAVIQPPYDDDSGRYVKTILMHGKSGKSIECRVPLIVNKNDMQGYGSAVTYARRYGLMAMAGIAPDDDDGHAAVVAKPDDSKRKETKQKQHEGPRFLTADQFIALREEAEKASVDMETIAAKVGAQAPEEIPAELFDKIMKGLASTIARNSKPSFDDEIKL